MKQEVRKAVMAVIVKDDKILIGSSPRDGGYKFPQGGLEVDENVINGIIRELKEELNLDITENDILQSYTEKVSYTYPNIEQYIFKRQELYVVKVQFNNKMILSPQDDEFDELLWIFPSDLPNYNTYFRVEAYTKALQICGLI